MFYADTVGLTEVVAAIRRYGTGVASGSLETGAPVGKAGRDKRLVRFLRLTIRGLHS